ncbi:MAG: YggS family pyridoxal phosphate-dependent enzyme [Candidatus Brocadiae bacterium]|nr:YggS family pyridoxal phosphate-dependent enzyme [Candidatus Brocadiia bacterium]
MDEAALRRNLDDVWRRMAAACERAGRQIDDVLLVAVVKTVDVDTVRALQALGVTDVGENRVQQAQAKREALGGGLGLRWHMIGHLQRNKVRHALPLFEMIHSVDSVRLARAIDERAAGEGRRVPILLQCNTSGEESKFGLSPAALPELLDAILPLEHVAVNGLMTMAPFVADPEETRPGFAALRELADQARVRTGLPLPHLSMGMTQDFEVAIEEGATLVRVGSALFRGVG